MFLLVLTSVLAVGTAPSASDAESYWKLENLTDSSANSHTLTNSGATASSSGKIDDCYSLDGSNDYMKVITDDFSIQEKTINLWVKTTDNDGVFLHYSEGIGSYYGFRVSISSNKVSFRYVSSSGAVNAEVSSTTSVNDGDWHMITAVDNGTDLNVYFDGVWEAKVTRAVMVYSSPMRVNFGALRPDGSGLLWYDGLIDEVAVFNVTLTADNVEYLYNLGAPTANQQYPFSVPSAYFDITNTNSINNMTAYFNSTTYSTTNGTINTGIEDSIEEFTILAQTSTNNYFTQTFPDYNISSDLDITFVEYPRITLYDNFTGDTLTGFNVTYVSNDTCYQESANVSDQSGIDGKCNLKYNGSYNFLNNFNDGDWGTGIEIEYNYSINYTIPDNIDSAILSIKSSVETYNISVISSCLTEEMLEIKIIANPYHTDDVDTYCKTNLSSWELINAKDVSNAAYLFEEAIHWTLSEPYNVTYYDNDTGVIYLPFNSSINVTIAKEDYLPVSIVHNFIDSNDLNASLYQSIIWVNVSESISGNPISDWALFNTTGTIYHHNIEPYTTGTEAGTAFTDWANAFDDDDSTYAYNINSGSSPMANGKEWGVLQTIERAYVKTSLDAVSSSDTTSISLYKYDGVSTYTLVETLASGTGDLEFEGYVDVDDSIRGLLIYFTSTDTAFDSYIYTLSYGDRGISTNMLIDTTSSVDVFYPNPGEFGSIVLHSNTGAFSDRSFTGFNVSSFEQNTIYYTFLPTKLNVTAINILNDASINNFSITYSSLNSTHSGTHSCTDGDIIFGVINGDTYNITIDADTYALFNNSVNKIITGNTNQIFSLYTNNSINFNVRWESSGLLVTNLTSIVLTSDTTSYSFNTSNGTHYEDQIIDGTYSIKASITGLDDKYYSVTVADRSHQDLTIYFDTNYSDVTFLFQDKNTGTAIEEVYFSLSRFVNGSLVAVSSKLSDITGSVSAKYVENTFYSVSGSKSGYTTKTFSLDPIDSATYIIKMDSSSSEVFISDGVSVYYSPKTFSEGLNNFSFTINSPLGLLSSYYLNVSYPNSSSYYSGTNANGEVFSFVFNITNPEMFDSVKVNYYYLTSLSGTDNKTFYHPIGFVNSSSIAWGNMDERFSDLGIFERMILVVLAVILVAGFGGSLALGLLVYVFFAATGFIPLWTIIVALFVGGVLVFRGGIFG